MEHVPYLFLERIALSNQPKNSRTEPALGPHHAKEPECIQPAQLTRNLSGIRAIGTLYDMSA